MSNNRDARNICDDAFLKDMVKARKAPSILKMNLVNFRSSVPCMPVLIFEGPDDKIVYFHWINKIRPNFQYEPFPCNGKENLLELKAIIDRDVNGLEKNIFFFVDRDFDDLRDTEPSPSIFMTDCYAVENYLLSDIVIEELMKNEFHCHGQPELRREILEKFKNLYREFLLCTKSLNKRIFFAVKFKFNIENSLPDKINKIVDMDINNVARSKFSESELVHLDPKMNDENTAEIELYFNSLNMSERYRGKFALMFLMRWLELLAIDRNSCNQIYFKWEKSSAKVRSQSITLDSLASKSPYPAGLDKFVHAIH